MFPKEEMISYLKEHLSKKRFQHCLRVAKLSQDLAEHYGENIEKAYFAGLCHDIAKEYDDKTCKMYIEKANIERDPCIVKNPNLAHGEIGGYVLKTQWHIEDEAVLDAVRWHTYGHANMSLLDKIVYLADVAEPSRNFEQIELLRKKLYEDLDLSIQYFFTLCTTYLTKENQSIHKNTYEMLRSIPK